MLFDGTRWDEIIAAQFVRLTPTYISDLNSSVTSYSPTTQFSADTVYLDLVSDSTTERLDQSHQAPPISDAKGILLSPALLTGQL